MCAVSVAGELVAGRTGEFRAMESRMGESEPCRSGARSTWGLNVREARIQPRSLLAQLHHERNTNCGHEYVNLPHVVLGGLELVHGDFLFVLAAERLQQHHDAIRRAHANHRAGPVRPVALRDLDLIASLEHLGV